MITVEFCSFRNQQYTLIRDTEVLNGSGPDVETGLREQWWNISPGDVVMDIGAGIGMWTLPALSVGASRAYAFEPEHAQTEVLRQSLVENGWSDRVNIVERFLGAESGVRCAHGQTIPIICLDAFVEENKIIQCNWIKIDVEGDEYEVLKGAVKTIQELRPNLVIEIHRFMDETLESRCLSLIGSIADYSISIAILHPGHVLHLRLQAS